MTVPSPRIRYDQRAPMRDGVELSADVYLPGDGEGPWPAILYRTPYDNSTAAFPELGRYHAGRGYAFVAQDVRGRGDSDGRFEPFVAEAADGYDTVEWVAAQPWCDGAVGMMGGSYAGFVQWIAAREGPPHLRALVSTAAAGRWMEELPYQFGSFTSYWAFWLNLVGGRSLQQPVQPPRPSLPEWPAVFTHRPLRDADQVLGRTNTVWRKWLEHSTFDDYWRALSLRGRFAELDLPVLHITGWFDGDQWGELFYWRGMIDDSPAGGRQWLVSGPWDHAGTRTPKQQLGGRDFGPDSVVDMASLHARFFDRWLKGIDNGQDRDPRVRIFAMGLNRWQDEAAWPPASVRARPAYLRSGGRAQTLAGDGRLSWDAPDADEPADTFTYDPQDPTPSVPDVGALPFGDVPFDNRWRLRRDDVLVYTSDPLGADLEVTGHPTVVLYASSDCIDTDWHVSLCDVLPNGRSDELTRGCLRASCRDGIDAPPTPLEPGRVYEFRLELMATSNVFRAGHRIRFCVASASFPTRAANPNTNAAPGDDDVTVVAHNTVHHTPARPSHVLLPMPERGGASEADVSSPATPSGA